MNNVRIPERIDQEVAYLCGMICGDGHLCVRPKKHEYSIYVTGNLNNEREFYEDILSPIFARVFGIEPKVKISTRDNTVNLIIYSKSIVNFFSERCGVPIGKKEHKVRIPDVFRDTDLVRSFLQGFADADLGLCLKRRYREVPYYPVIGGSSKSKQIILDVSEVLMGLGITFSLSLDRTSYDNRIRKETTRNMINIYGRKNVFLWMKFIGYRNPKYLKIFEKTKNIAGVRFELTTFTPRLEARPGVPETTYEPDEQTVAIGPLQAALPRYR